MPSHKFDPFNKRLARDIRNNLSHAFLHALAEKDAATFHRCGADYLRKNLEPSYEAYVRDRLARYSEAFTVIEQGKLKDVLQRAAVTWDLKLYFEMHELLELEWKVAEGDRRGALQGLIRAAGMKIHAGNNNLGTAVKMGAKALDDLLKYGGELAGFVQLDAIITETQQYLAQNQGQNKEAYALQRKGPESDK